jgi:hypothetical protein
MHGSMNVKCQLRSQWPERRSVSMVWSVKFEVLSNSNEIAFILVLNPLHNSLPSEAYATSSSDANQETASVRSN